MRDGILDTLGSPLVRVGSPPGATVAAKVESFNPGGSAKDRPALAMVERAAAEGAIAPGDRLVEPTSGNTGIGLAMVAAAKGYDLTVVMPASKSEERRRLMRAYGADIELVEGDISAARERADEIEAGGAVQLRQFENPANPDAHYETTGPEILDELDGRAVDAFVAGVGTGGTITGVGRRLREAFPDVPIVAVEPAASPVLSTGAGGTDEFQGMGPGFVSDLLDVDLLDGVETVPLDAAEAECKRLARDEGIIVGQSSGASNLAARRVARRLADGRAATDGSAPVAVGGEPAPEGAGAGEGSLDPEEPSAAMVEASADDLVTTDQPDAPLVVTVFWDSGERYLSAGLFD
ncbi:MAG: PLP-dependent cysteine synthase family protein [Halobacteriaceae archaeon]